MTNVDQAHVQLPNIWKNQGDVRQQKQKIFPVHRSYASITNTEKIMLISDSHL